MFKICAVGLMRNRDYVVSEIKIYFHHLRNPGCPNGFQRQTVLGKIISGDMGGSYPGSAVPKGIEMSDSEYLCSINRVDLALVALKSYDVQHEASLWDFVHARYRYGLKYSELVVVFDKSARTLHRWNDDALLLISNRIC